MSIATITTPVATPVNETPAFSPPYHVESASDSENEEEGSSKATCYGVKMAAKTPPQSPILTSSPTFQEIFNDESGKVTVQKKQKITKEEKQRKAAERKAKKQAAEEEKERKAAERKAKKQAAEEEKVQKAAQREAKKKLAEEKKAALEAEKAEKAAKREAKKILAEKEKAEKAAKKAEKAAKKAEKAAKKQNPTSLADIQTSEIDGVQVIAKNNASTNILATLGIGEEAAVELKVEEFVALPDADAESQAATTTTIETSQVDEDEDDNEDMNAESPSDDSLDLDAEEVSKKMNTLRKYIKRQNELLDQQKANTREINKIYGELANLFGEITAQD